MVKVVGNTPDRKIDLILVSAPSLDGYRSNQIREIPAYGLGLLATIANRRGYNVGVLDAEAQSESSLEKISKEIERLNPRFIGFSSNTPMYKNTLKIASTIKKDIPIIIGGSHASALPKQTAEDLRLNNFYLLINGPGEDSITEILSGTPRERINGASYFNEKGKFIENKKKKIGQFEDYPRIDRSFFINDPIPLGREMTSFLLSSRGCFYDCSFCSIHTTWNQKVMFRNLEDITEEMGELYSKGTRSFRFLDDLFLVSPSHSNRFYEELKLKKLLRKIEWAANSRVNIINRMSSKDIKNLKESGCKGIGLGIESGSDGVLKEIGKGFTTRESENAVKKLTKEGIKTYGYFILGFPRESEEEIKNTLEFAYKLSKKYGLKGGIVPYKLYPGSRDYKEIVGENPSRERVHQLLQFKPATLTSPEDTKKIKSILKERERHTVIHDSEIFNPSRIEINKIVNYIRNFYLRTRSS